VDGGPPQLQITPGGHDFGDVVLDVTSPSFTFTVQNIGQSPSLSQTVQINPPFALASNGCNDGTLFPGGTCQLQVTFTPSKTTFAEDSLTVTPSSGTGDSVDLNGHGVQAGALQLSPQSNDFGWWAMGRQSPALAFTVTNVGGSPITATDIATDDGNDPQFVVTDGTCGEPIDPGKSCVVFAAFQPRSEGSHEANLTVSNSDGSSTTSAMLSGTATLSQGGLRIDLPQTVMDLTDDDPSNDQAVITVFNDGQQTFTRVSLSLGVDGSNAFFFGEGNCGGQLAPGQQCSAPIAVSGRAFGGRLSEVVNAFGFNVQGAVSGTANGQVVGIVNQRGQ
jgi:hypothetical protein